MSKLVKTVTYPFTGEQRTLTEQDHRLVPSREDVLTFYKTHERLSWSLTELHIYHDEHEIPRAPQWRLKASSNPWDVTFAFDNNVVTRWASDTAYQPGMYVEVNFQGIEEIDRVVADCTRDQEQMRMRLDAEILPGRWQTILETGHLSDIIAPQGMRALAVQELERNHIHWLLIRDKQGGADDYYQHQNLWGIRLVAATGLYKLYHLE